MMLLSCGLEIWSDKTLEEVAELISHRLLGGVRFVGKDEHIRDEVPAVFTEHNILGMQVILTGGPGTDGYFLHMESRFESGIALSAEEITRSLVDISPIVARLLQDADGLTVSFKGI